jgi:hypothetical protein
MYLSVKSQRLLRNQIAAKIPLEIYTERFHNRNQKLIMIWDLDELKAFICDYP